MPRDLHAHVAAAMGGKIYVTGGESQGSSVNSVYVYDPQVDIWAQLASMSIARRLHASVAVGGKLYVFGGFGTRGKLGSVEVYDPASDSWAQGLGLTSPRSGAMAVAL